MTPAERTRLAELRIRYQEAVARSRQLGARRTYAEQCAADLIAALEADNAALRQRLEQYETPM